MKKRILSLLLCGAMLFSLCSQSVLAVGNEQAGGVTVGTSGLCEHHPEHNADCGYTEGSEGTPCGHEHTADCYEEVTNCVHEHDEDCYPEESDSGNEAAPSGAQKREPENCSHICNEDSGCITKELNCQHEHNGECGYSPATEGTPCGYVCELCGGENSGKPATPSNAETVTVASVQAMIDALPGAEEITGDNAEEVKTQLEAIDEAKEKLSDEEIDELDITRYMEAAAVVERLLYGTAAPSNAVMLADYDGPAIVIGTDGISGYSDTDGYHYIYYGTWNNSPIKWRVLDDKTNTGADGLFLLSDSTLGTGISFDKTSPYSNAWQGSDAQSWCSSFYKTNLTATEQGAVLETTKSDDAFTSSGSYVYQFSASVNILSGDKVFFLSAEETQNRNYGYAYHSTNYNAWWLRSPVADRSDGVGIVTYAGNVTTFSTDYGFAARPALNLNLDSVLFTSAAAGGKEDTAVDENLTAVGAGTGEWKLTLKDTNRQFFVASNKTAAVTAERGGTVEISYATSETGSNEYVSAMLVNNSDNTVLYYGRIVNSVDNEATVRVTIPAGLTPGGSYTLKVFSEQCNGDNQTDYASDFEDISITVYNEQFSLEPGGTYYFDLSGETIYNTPDAPFHGYINNSLPDTSLHYIPFTYVGTVDAYKLTSYMQTTEEYAQQNKYVHSLFVSDYAVSYDISWEDLNAYGLLWGNDYESDGVDYTLRVLSMGSGLYENNYNFPTDSRRGTPQSNEWDAILNKNDGYIQNWRNMYSWGQDMSSRSSACAVCRGGDALRSWSYRDFLSSPMEFGFRPVLEVLNPDTLGSDGLKAVTLDLNGGKLGGSSDDIQIIVKNGSTFTAPVSDGLTRPDGDTGSYFMWLDGNGSYYAPGASVPADVTELTVQWTAPTYTVTLNTSGGTINSGNVTEYTYGVGATLPTDVSRAGYVFGGWYKDSSFSGSPVPAISDTETGNKEYWAKWEVNQYTVTIKPENGEADIIIKQDYGTPVSAPILTREGYKFNGWDKTFPTTMPDEDMTITALWLDVAVPTGEIKIDENGWNSFLNKITFGLFFKNTQTVTITAADNSGETVTIEYLLSDKTLAKDELTEKTFTAYSAPFHINPDNEYVVYAKLTDTSGNVAYINTDGIVLDATVPGISGVVDGKTYCAAQTVTVDEKYIDTITVNGNAIALDSNHQFTLNPAEGTQTIAVTDKAGNETTVVVTVNDGHTYEWQSENGRYWQKCKFCGDETAKKDIPTIAISGADKVCKTQDYKFSFTLPKGATDAIYGYEFIGKGDDHITPALENGLYSGIIKATAYPAEENSFKLIVNATTADGFAFSVEKTVVIQNEHTGGTSTCTEQATCGICGESYGELNANNHSNLKHIDAKAATKTAEGNIEYWYCSGCDKYYKDAAATKEIAEADTVTAKLLNANDSDKSTQTGDNSNLTLWIALLLASGGLLTVIVINGVNTGWKRRKRHE